VAKVITETVALVVVLSYMSY